MVSASYYIDQRKRESRAGGLVCGLEDCFIVELTSCRRLYTDTFSFMMAADMADSYGRRLIPQILDRLAASDPERIVFSIASFPENTGPSFREITAAAFTRAVDKTAWWLHAQLDTSHGQINGDGDLPGDREAGGQPTPKIRPLGYIGPRKLRDERSPLAIH